ncbi:hypothetical protein [Rhizobium sp. CCGE 510]|uniref:hypothetical protein n=1 Tax=Rhizobium sp. CCGE 510 TaxID=1132836 RepID=UPI00027B9058|nr:hypothetical protein [Rhizobium sp. CCGE 510]EJT01562.1 hypothetical protein RCCGE510_29996 [Rhizobium sp. CCGE 510]
MASPWKFLARLISPGREQKRENGSTEKVPAEAVAISDPTETPAEERVNGAARTASEELPGHGKGTAISLKPVHSDKAKNGGRDKIERGAAKIGQDADPALSCGTGIDVTAAHDTTEIRRALEVAPRKQRRRSKEAVTAVANVSPISQVVHTAEEINLDEEIRVLRGQLAGKLTLQNAQLRKMLERFER